MKVLLDEKTNDNMTLKLYSLITIYYLCKNSTRARRYILRNINYVILYELFNKINKMDILTDNKSFEKPPEILFRSHYLQFISLASEEASVHEKLIDSHIIELCKILSDYIDGEYIFAAHILKHLSKSEVGSNEIIKENLFPYIVEKVFPSKKKLPEWRSYGLYQTDISLVKFNDFLNNMISKCSDEIQKRYPQLNAKLIEVQKQYQKSYESSIQMYSFLNNFYAVSITFLVGVLYGTIRSSLRNYFNPTISNSILKNGAIPAAVGSAFTIGLKKAYDTYYDKIWSDERLFLLERIGLSSAFVLYFYGLGILAPYSIIPFLVGNMASVKNEFDFEAVKKQKERVINMQEWRHGKDE